jgi:hypothetical protein
MKTLLLTMIATFTIFANAARAESGPGGGDSVSQEFYKIAKDLPKAIEAKGLDYFPEINIQEFSTLINTPDFLKVEKVESKLDSQGHAQPNLFLDGIPKDAITDTEAKLSKIDAFSWTKKNESEKTSLVFHEILVLMKLETNDDYHISYRLFGPSYYLPANVTSPVVDTGEIASNDFNNPEVIVVLIHENKTRTFQYCANRNIASTCRILGLRAYTLKELANKKRSLLIAAHNWRQSGNAVVANSTAGGALIGFFLGGGIPGELFVGGLFGFLSAEIASDIYYEPADRVESRTRLMKGKALRGQIKVNTSGLELSEVAQYLHMMLTDQTLYYK